MRPVAVGLSLKPHGVEGAGDVALGTGHSQRGASDVAHLGGDEKRPHALAVDGGRDEREKERMRNKKSFTQTCVSAGRR